MSDEKSFALSERHRMGSDRTDGIERRARAANESMLNREDSLRNHSEIAAEEEVIDPNDGTRERIFDGREKSIGCIFFDGPKGRIKCRARDRGDFFAEEADGGFFAEGAGLALEGDSHRHLTDVFRSHNLVGLVVWRNCGGVTGWAQEMRDLARWAALYDEMKMGRLQAGCGVASRKTAEPRI
jgi:hypothetical protein